jgi:hypothetical protein
MGDIPLRLQSKAGAGRIRRLLWTSIMSLSLECSLALIFTPIPKIRRIVQLLMHKSGRAIMNDEGCEATKSAPPAGSEAPTSDSQSSKIETERANPHEVEMRTIDEIVAATLKTTEASLREAFEAGRAHTASALKNRMAAFFEGLISEAEGKIAAVAAPPHPEPPHSEPAHQPPPTEPHHADPQPDAHHA